MEKDRTTLGEIFTEPTAQCPDARAIRSYSSPLLSFAGSSSRGRSNPRGIMKCCGLAIARGAINVETIDVMVTVRQLEEKVQETVLDGYSAALWALILFAPGRLRRLLSASI